MSLTGKTIGELTKLSAITETTLFPVEFSGETFHIPYSSITTNIKPYKVYTAIVTVWDNDAPIAIELENTIGTITITKDELNTGQYRIDSDSLFTEDKTILFYGSIGKQGESTSGLQLISNWAAVTRITLDAFVDGLESNFVVWKTPIEIRVYN